MTVRATDRGSPPLWSEATLTVHLVDVNENTHAPAFADLVQAASVKENMPPGTLVTTVKASDADAPGDDSRVTYSIRGGDGQGYFSIDEKGKARPTSSILAPLAVRLAGGGDGVVEGGEGGGAVTWAFPLSQARPGPHPGL